MFRSIAKGIAEAIGRVRTIEKQGMQTESNVYGWSMFERPTDSFMPMGAHDVAKIPLVPYTFKFMYDLYYFSDTLRTILRALVWEIFRNGIEIRQRFACKCTVCGSEYQHYVKVCPNCGSDKIRLPNLKQRRQLEEIMKKCNINNDSLIDVLKDFTTDICVCDNGFLVVIKEYYFDENGYMIGAKPIEILRGSPMKIRLIMSRDGRPGYTDDGRVVLMCLEHRDKIKLVKPEEAEKGVRCDKCGKIMYPAWYEVFSALGKNTYYTAGEILHTKMFTTGIGYGMSPLMTVLIKTLILMKMDWFVLTAYHLQRPPKGILILKGQRESIAKAWQWLMEQARLNPHMIYPLIVESGEGTSRRVAEWIDLTIKAQDIDFIQYREELRRTIGAVFGVLPLWLGDVKGAGGLANEGLQVIVTNRTIEAWQRLFNDKVFPWLLEQLGITDYELRLRPNELRDELTELEIETRKLQIAKMLEALGYDVKIVKEDDKLQIKFKERNITEQLIELLEALIKATKSGVSVTELMEIIDKVLKDKEFAESILDQIKTEGEDLKVEGSKIVNESGTGVIGTAGELAEQYLEQKVESEGGVRTGITEGMSRIEGEPERKRPNKYSQRAEGESLLPRKS